MASSCADHTFPGGNSTRDGLQSRHVDDSGARLRGTLGLLSGRVGDRSKTQDYEPGENAHGIR